MCKNVISRDNIVYSTRDYTMFYKELNNISKSLGKKDKVDIFNIRYKDYKFNCLPFLLNGTGYFSQSYRSTLTDSIARLSMTTEPCLMSEFNNVEGLDIKLFDSLIPALADMGIRMLGAYQYKNQPKDLIRILFRGSVETFETVILNGEMIHYKYKYSSICNTQAFSYYISILWLMSLSPFLYSLGIRDLRRVGFFDLLESLIPEESIHFKYICGELTSEELYEEYQKVRYDDGSSVCNREIMSNNTQGEYLGEDLDYKAISTCSEIYDTYTLNEDYKMNMHLAYCFLFDGTYKRLNNEISTLTMANEREREKNERNSMKLRQTRDSLNKLNSLVKEQSKEIVELRSKLSSIETDDDLKSEISNLRNEIKQLKSENEHLFNERTSLKQLISSQKKKIKSLMSRVQGNSDLEETFDDKQEDTIQVSLDYAISKIKDLRITYVGCDNNSIDSKMNSVGITNITRFSGSQRAIGKCDILLIFAIRCHHSEVYKAEKLCRGRDIPVVYLSCVNIEQVIMTIYSTMYE